MTEKSSFEEQSKQEENISAEAGFVKEFLQFMWERKLWWMVPLVLVLVLVGVLLFVASSAGPAAPFIYSIF